MERKVKIVCSVIAWIVCGVMAYGILLGQMEYDFHDYETGSCREDQGFSAIISVGGPFTLVDSLLMSGAVAHGVKWTCDGTERRTR